MLSLSSQINSYVFQFVLLPQIPLFLSPLALACSSCTICLHFHIFSFHFSPVLTDLERVNIVFLYFFFMVSFSKLQSGNWQALICYNRNIRGWKETQFRTCSVASARSSKAASLENMVEYCRKKNNPVMFSVVEC